jgi:predicted Zn finger-like uncharacterized protein
MDDISRVHYTSEFDSDRLFVKKDNLARCAWCGTPESPKWVVNQKGEMFCSSECQSAKDSSRAIDIGFLTAFCGGIIILIPIIAILLSPVPYSQPITSNQFGSIAGWIISGFLFLIVGVAGMIAGYEGKKYRDRKGKYNDVTLLQCEYCNQTNPPNMVRCQYCGASLTKAPFRYETTPPWIRKEMYLGRFRCPHCSSTYSYDASKLENDGSVRCQNCGKPFAPPFPHDQWQESSVESSLYADV